jgi:organic radical activating enzyme
MTKRLIKVKQQTNTMLLTWIINNICNNHCAYCPPILHTGKNHHYEWEKAKEFLYRLFSHYPRIHCSISGGEPTLSPFFKELVEIFYENNHQSVEVSYARPNAYREGKHEIELYAEGFLIGLGSFEVR